MRDNYSLSLHQLTTELIACAAKTANSVQKQQHQTDISLICADLAHAILTRTYHPQYYTRFAVVEPKLREIYAPSFRDRLAQCWLVSYAEPLIERQFIEDTFANRQQKGSLKAIERAQRFMRQPAHTYYLQLDIQAFFNSINRSLLLKRWLDDLTHVYLNQAENSVYATLRYLSTQIIAHSATDSSVRLSGYRQRLNQIPSHKLLTNTPHHIGLPIGSVTSQLFANYYLSLLDHFIKHQLNVAGYCRYMDGLMLFAASPAQLLQWQAEISHYLSTELHLTLHPTKQHLQRCRQGAHYLGYYIYPHYRYVKQNNVKKLRYYLQFFNHLLDPLSPPVTPPDKPYWQKAAREFKHYFAIHRGTHRGADFTVFVYPYLIRMQAVLNSYLSLLAKGRHYVDCLHIYQRYFVVLKHYFLPNDHCYCSVRIKKWLLTEMGDVIPPL